jgi:hypothetical protein
MTIDTGASGIWKPTAPNGAAHFSGGEGTKGHFGYAITVNMAGIGHVLGHDVAFRALDSQGKQIPAHMLLVRSHP